MQMFRTQTPSRRFTLIEMLVVMTIVTILSALLMGGIRSAILKAELARGNAQLLAIDGALTSYSTELRALPRPQPGTTPEALLSDSGPWLYAALMNREGAGGGPSAPYVKGSDITIGVITARAVLGADTMGKDGETGCRPLSPDERARLSLFEFQSGHDPTDPEPLVFLDPWGNPWHCRIWKGVDTALKQQLKASPPQRSGFQALPESGGREPVEGPVPDFPHDPVRVDIWSNGPNGVNEYGAGDDLRSW